MCANLAQLISDCDPVKATKNLAKHRVSFAEAATVFDDDQE
jgi:uncharacterized DUF497 family protein